MKKLMLWTIALAMLLGGTLHAQNLAGNWQGTLEAGPRKLRIIFKISLDDDKWKATLYSIDQQGPGMAATSVVKDGSTVKIAIGGLGSYEGKLSASGNEMTGTWTQGAALALNLVRATPETAWTIPDPPKPPVRMAANADPAFEVATIKPSEPGRPGKLFTVRGRDVVTVNTTFNDLITMAYNVHARQITGGPAWLDSDKYDLNGRPDVPGQPNVAQIKVMLQKLLADRFQLQFHREKKELSVYAITVAKAGAIAKSQADPNGLPGLFFGGAGPGGGLNFNVRNATMAQVASTLQGSILDRPVVDQTGLTDKYDFIVKFTPDAGQMAGFGGPPPGAAAADNPEAPPDLFAAFRQQLGLKIEGSKAEVDVLVIDKVEKPSAN